MHERMMASYIVIQDVSLLDFIQAFQLTGKAGLIQGACVSLQKESGGTAAIVSGGRVEKSDTSDGLDETHIAPSTEICSSPLI